MEEGEGKNNFSTFLSCKFLIRLTKSSTSTTEMRKVAVLGLSAQLVCGCCWF